MVPERLDARHAPYPLEDRCPLLREIVASRRVLDAAGNPLRLHSNISRIEANALYETVKRRKPETVLEIGMAFGVSSLAILAALNEVGTGVLISIDPNQTAGEWNGAGIANVRRSGLSHRHTLIEKPDYLALPELLSAGTHVDAAYIDGRHTFEYVLLDFFYIDKMLAVRGVVGFNDAGWRSVHKVLRFLRRHRRYAEVDVGLPHVYVARNFAVKAARWALDAPTQDRYFEKREHWETPWDFYVGF
jgi:predicted O-methyltransferase YrrM